MCVRFRLTATSQDSQPRRSTVVAERRNSGPPYDVPLDASEAASRNRRAADIIITMGCGDACPVYPGKRYLDWELTDPAGKAVDEVRPIVDEIDRRVRALLDELELPPGPRSA